jgi:hypothetical protein
VGTAATRCITKSGNAHLRGVVVEAAQHSTGTARRVAAEGAAARAGSAGAGGGNAAKAQQRLYRRYRHLVGRNGRCSQQAIVAVARELLGFIWAVGQEVAAASAGTAARSSAVPLHSGVCRDARGKSEAIADGAPMCGWRALLSVDPRIARCS